MRATGPLILLLVATCALTMGAAIGIQWKRSEVIPVILVKPGIGGFEPVEGTAIGNRWSKDDVRPVILVKPGIGGFEPREGTSIGNQWNKEELLAVMLVEPAYGGFVPLRMLINEDEGKSADRSSRNPTLGGRETGSASTPAVVETTIDGNFEGWEGETVVKLANGQIWEQSDFHVHYHFAFQPKVMILKSGGGYKMHVDGTDRAVGVKRLK